MKKIGLIWADPFKGNRGVGALAYSSIYIIDEILGKEPYELLVIGTKEGVHELNIGEKKIQFIGIRSIHDWKSLLKLLIIRPKFLKQLLGLDYILDIGGGDSFADIYGQKRFDQIFFTKWLFKFLKKPIILLPQTIGPFSKKSNEKKARDIINYSKLVFPRDSISFNYTKEISNNQNVFESIDVAFFLPYQKDKAISNSNMVRIGLNVSGLLWHGGYFKKNDYNLKVNYKEFTISLIEKLLAMKNVEVILTPHVVHNYKTLENDYEVSLQILNKIKNHGLTVSPFFLDPIEAKSFISNMDFFIGARMHSCIAAYSSGVPVFPLAYSRKFNGLFSETLDYPSLGDMVHFNENKLLDFLIKDYNRKDDLRKLIQNMNEELIKAKKQELLEKLFNTIGQI